MEKELIGDYLSGKYGGSAEKAKEKLENWNTAEEN